jgi:nucleoside-diphosphate-sugar epimerase
LLRADGDCGEEGGRHTFVYCSSSSVYGVSDSPNVTEDHPLVPLTLYNKFKGMCEPVLWKHKSDEFTCVVIRPATLCGYSPRTRLDLSVNILTNHAVNKGTITVFGGNQMRPNLHIEDMVDAYLLMLSAPHEKIHGETFNIGFQNYSIAEIANMVKKGRRRGNAGAWRDQDRHHADQRHAVLSRQFRQGETCAWL